MTGVVTYADLLRKQLAALGVAPDAAPRALQSDRDAVERPAPCARPTWNDEGPES